MILHLLYMILLLISLEMFAGPQIILSSSDFQLRNGESKTLDFNCSKKTPSILYFSCRMKMNRGENWGINGLYVMVNGKKLTADSLLLNKPKVLKNTFVQPIVKQPCVNDEGLWFIKQDSDWTAFNDEDEGTYFQTKDVLQVNRDEMDNIMFNYALDISELVQAGKNNITLGVTLPEIMKKRIIEFKDIQVMEAISATFFVRDWMQGVYPWTTPFIKEIRRPLKLFCASNEYEPVAFALHSAEDIPNASLQINIPGIPESAFGIYVVADSPFDGKKQQWSMPLVQRADQKIFHPELLIPSDGHLTIKKGSTAFVADFNAAGIKPGCYNGTVYLMNNAGKLIAEKSIEIEVLPVVLPPSGELPVEYGLFTMCKLVRNDKLSEMQLADIAAHGATFIFMTPWTSPIPLKISDGKLVADFSNLERDIATARRFGLNKRHVFFGTSEPILAQIRELTGQNTGEAEFDRMFVEFTRLLFEKSEKEGWNLYFSLFDEVNGHGGESKWKQFVHLLKLTQQVPISKIWNTITEESSANYLIKSGLFKNKDILMSHPSQLYTMDRGRILKSLIPGADISCKVEDALKTNKWEYHGISAFPAEINRSRCGISLWRSRLLLFMGFCYYWGDAEKAQSSPQLGIYYVTYPFPEQKNGRLHGTVGWLGWREGVDDYRWLQYAKNELSQKVGTEKAEEFISEILILLPESTDKFKELRKRLLKTVKNN